MNRCVYLYTITEEHVKSPPYDLLSTLGRVLMQDIGKRVYRVGNILQVENDEQRAMRTRKC